MIIHLALFQVLFILPICILLIFMPYWTRKTESFGVTFPEKMYHHSHIKTVRKRYSFHMASVSVLIILSLIILSRFLSLSDETTVLYSVIGMVVLFVIGFLYYLYFHHQMKLFKQTNVRTEEKKQVVIVQTSFYTEKKTISNAWYIIPFVMIIGTIVFTQLNYNLFPNKIPMNFNLTGEATSWLEKSEASVLFIPLMQLYLLVLFLFVNIIIRTAKQQTDPNHPKKSLKQNVIFRRRWSGFLFLLGTLMIALFSFIQYALAFGVSQTIQASVLMSVTAFGLLGSIYLSFKMGQGGSRIHIDTESENDHTDSYGDDDKYWKLGMFYVNKNDPSLFIEKRFGVGWSVNFARPLIWIIIGLILVFSIVLILFVP